MPILSIEFTWAGVAAIGEQTTKLQALTGRLHEAQFETVLDEWRTRIGQSGDVVFRLITFEPGRRRACLVYIKELVDQTQLSRQVLASLTERSAHFAERIARAEDLGALLGATLPAVNIDTTTNRDEIERSLLSGAAALFIAGCDEVALFTLEGTKYRDVSQTQVQNVLRGPLEAFVEHLESNLSLLRRRLQDPNLRIEFTEIGLRTKTKTAICSIAGLTNPKILANVRRLVQGVQVDGVTDSGEFLNLLHEGPLNIFPLALSTERPDQVVHALLEGRTVVALDGSPLVLIMPAVYTDFFRTMEDFYLPWLLAGMLRALRNLADHIMGLAPGVYVALASFTPGIMQPQFLNVVASTRAQVPYPPLVEAFLGSVLADFIVEATVRSPKVVGNAVPIVGGIIIGSVLTQTHLVSEVMVVVAALTTIAQFTAVTEPSLQLFGRFNKYWFLIWAGMFGLVGVMVAATIQLAYIASLNSAGVPYLSPIAPFHFLEAIDAKFGLPARWRPRRRSYLDPLDQEHIGQQESSN